MASAEIRQEIVDRVVARRGRLPCWRGKTLFSSPARKRTCAANAPPATLSDEEQRATLENMIQQFGDVLTADEALSLFDRRR